MFASKVNALLFLVSKAIEEDSWESWEDTDADTIQLATTPTKPSVLQSPKSPGPLKVYDLDYLLQFKPQPPNMRVKRMFPEPAPPKKEEKKVWEQAICFASMWKCYCCTRTCRARFMCVILKLGQAESSLRMKLFELRCVALDGSPKTSRATRNDQALD